MKALLTAALTALAMTAAAAAPQPPAEQLHRVLSRYHDLGQLDGAVLVAERGQVVYQQAFGLANREWQQPSTTDTAFRLASLSKQFTAALVLKLAEQGKLALDDKVGHYVPDLAPHVADHVTLHQLLNHTSGIVDYANHPGFWTGRLGSPVPRADFMAIMNQPLQFVPGSEGRYNSSGYNLLGYVVEKVTGKPFAQALDEIILKPLDMRRSGVEMSDRIVARMASGYLRVLGQHQPAAAMHMPNVFSSGAMYSTVGDMLKWDRALYADTLLSPASKALMFTPYVKDDVWGDLGFGYGWMSGRRVIAGAARLVHEHGGNTNGFRTLITRYPEDQRLVLILLNEGNGRKGRAIYDIRSAITNILYRVPVSMPAPTLGDAVVAAIARHGPAAAPEQAPRLRHAAARSQDANELNNLAYQYVGRGDLASAVAALKINIELFPADANSHDSLGEILLMRGAAGQALHHYRRALQMDPANIRAGKIVKQLEKEANSSEE